ncbi:MAG: DegT/DnrJ/EryC1/StrS family aminotransferase, partial [Micromonosporaceae bacterium]|nr:DegT/DnrJ/EryC1/StrS family aminotransferase [Micromonosporaceae bacterium]
MTLPILDTKHVLVGEPEHAAVRRVLDSADVSGNAAAVDAYEADLAAWFENPFAVACSSGTAAIHLALLALGVRRGDEVIVAATAPVMTVLPVLALGAIPVFADVAHPATFALDLDDAANKVTPRTKVVISVPMWGYPADGTALEDFCARWNLAWVEDAAQAHGTIVEGRHTGTLATIGTFSTHARKLVTTGEGGFCLTGSDRLDRRLRVLRNLGQPVEGGEFGTRFGLNYKLGAVAAAIGSAQLSRLRLRITQRLATMTAIQAIADDESSLVPWPVPDQGSPNGYAALFSCDQA